MTTMSKKHPRPEQCNSLDQSPPKMMKQDYSLVSNEQIVGMLEMAAKNKINMKNAFDLRLIDMLPEAVKHESFARCGSMIDASSKIYAYRVDRTHMDAHRVRARLGRGDEPGNDDTERAIDDDPDDASRAKKKHKAMAKTIESNPRAIMAAASKLEYEDDTLFRKTVAQFDEGSLAGLMLNQAMSAADAGHLLLHTISTPIVARDRTPADAHIAARINEIIRSIIGERGVDDDAGQQQQQPTICSELDEFDFTLRADDRDIMPSVARDLSSTSSMYRADIDDECVLDWSDDGVAAVDTMITLANGDANETRLQAAVGDAEAELFRQPKRAERLQNLLADTRDQDTCYFDKKKLDTMQGPNHWKINEPFIKKPPAAGRKVTKKVARRKDRIELDEDDADYETFAKSLAAKYRQMVPKKLMRSGAASKTESPFDRDYHRYDYNRTQLVKYCLRPDITIRQTKLMPTDGTGAGGDGAADDDDIDAYDFDNANDSINYCADGEPTVAASVGGGAPSDHEGELGIDIPLSDETMMPLPSTSSSMLPTAVKIVDKPINYARKVKKIDARGLKRVMRKILSTTGSGSQELHIDGVKSFSELCTRLPDMLPRSDADDLSVPIAFVIFLHLCNEHALCLEQPSWTSTSTASALSDFHIHEEG